jgi:vitamin B12/bleomycin/antimicrobial peptide transport system ATP-binding/permease protein
MATAAKRTTARTRWRRGEGRTWDRFARMLRRFATSEAGGKARWLFTGLLVLLVTINGLNVVNSYVGRDFMTALERRQTSIFVRQAFLYLGVFALSTLTIVTLRYTEETLALTWREWLSRWAVRHYLRPPVYHRLSDRLIANGEVANPDQRISDDVRAFTSTTLSLLILFLNGSFTILAFAGVMWSISPLLFLVTVLYAGAGSLFAIAWGRPLVRLNAAQLDREADFRGELIHVRENAEPLAIARREDRLRVRLLRRIDDLVANYRRIIKVNRNLGLFTTGYNYLIQIIPVLVVAPLLIRGTVEFGVVTQSAMAFAQLVGAFSLIITQFQSISSYAAVVTRLGVLDEGIEQAQSRPVLPTEVCQHHYRTGMCPICAARPLPASAIEMTPCGDPITVAYDRLTLFSPADGRVLIKELNGCVTPETRLLILGPNDEAKSALFRATAGTWEMGSGKLVRPGGDRILFIAERPYLPPGTMKEVLTGVDQEPVVSPGRIAEVIRSIDLDPVVARVGGLEVERRWDNILSLGEQKLVTFARVLLSAPSFLFLERPATGLAPEQLDRILDLLARASISVITVGRTEDAVRFYNSVLELKNDGGWQWNPLRPVA